MPKRILLCDDEVHIVRAAEIKFTRAGYDVHVAFDGEEGWQKVLECLPDIVIVDCQMPRLNGIAFAERVHSDPHTVHIPVIMLTGKGFELSHTEMREKYNILAVLSKPFSPRNLLERVEQLLNSQSQKVLAGTALTEVRQVSNLSTATPSCHSPSMQLPTEIFGEVIVVHAPEELGEECAHQFEEFITTQDRVKVILEMDGTETLDSAGLASLLNAYDLLREQKGDLRISTNNKVNRKILEITRLDQQFEIYETVLDAVKSFA